MGADLKIVLFFFKKKTFLVYYQDLKIMKSAPQVLKLVKIIKQQSLHFELKIQFNSSLNAHNGEMAPISLYYIELLLFLHKCAFKLL